MRILEKIIGKIKKNGLRYTIILIIKRLSEALFINFGRVMFCLLKTEDIIVIESHNDFDCNGGAFYDYLLSKQLNMHWKIVWLVSNPIKNILPENVFAFDFYGYSLKKEYYLNKARYLMYDDKYIKKRRKNQKEVYCSHGIPIKNVKGKICIPNYVDYILSCSENYDPYICYSFSVPYPNNKMLHFGYPYNDVLYKEIENECRKITTNQYTKTILWMPTFRQKSNREDSELVSPLGVPLFANIQEYECLNKFLNELNCLLIIKIHPMQLKKSYEMLFDMSNIIVLDGVRIKELSVDNYRLLKACDAMISDYSSIAYSFLLLNRPMGFVLSDYKEYKPGFIMENYEEFLPGNKIYSLEDLYYFIEKLYTGKDDYLASRKKLIDFLYMYKDGNACARLANFFDMC